MKKDVEFFETETGTMNPQQTKQKVAELISGRECYQIVIDRNDFDKVRLCEKTCRNRVLEYNQQLTQLKTDLEAWLEKFEGCRQPIHEKTIICCGVWHFGRLEFCPSCQNKKQPAIDLIKQIEEALG